MYCPPHYTNITIFCDRRQINRGKWSWVPTPGVKLSINRVQYQVVEVRQNDPNHATLMVARLTKKPEE